MKGPGGGAQAAIVPCEVETLISHAKLGHINLQNIKTQLRK